METDVNKMKLTEKQIWKCNNTEDGEVHICLDYQDVVGFARAIEREIGFTRSELWLKRIDDAVKAERKWVGLTDVEVGDALIELPILGNGYFLRIAKAIEAKLKEKNT
jgi:hypothetical protein